MLAFLILSKKGIPKFLSGRGVDNLRDTPIWYDAGRGYYLYSAFWDSRPEFVEKPTVRIISIIPYPNRTDVSTSNSMLKHVHISIYLKIMTYSIFLDFHGVLSKMYF